MRLIEQPELKGGKGGFNSCPILEPSGGSTRLIDGFSPFAALDGLCCGITSLGLLRGVRS